MGDVRKKKNKEKSTTVTSFVILRTNHRSTCVTGNNTNTVYDRITISPQWFRRFGKHQDIASENTRPIPYVLHLLLNGIPCYQHMQTIHTNRSKAVPLHSTELRTQSLSQKFLWHSTVNPQLSTLFFRHNQEKAVKKSYSNPTGSFRPSWFRKKDSIFQKREICFARWRRGRTIRTEGMLP